MSAFKSQGRRHPWQTVKYKVNINIKNYKELSVRLLPTPNLAVSENTRGRQEHAEVVALRRRQRQSLSASGTQGSGEGACTQSIPTSLRTPEDITLWKRTPSWAIWDKGASDSSRVAEMTAGLDVRALPTPLNAEGQACTTVLLLQQEPRRYSLEKAKGPRRS